MTDIHPLDLLQNYRLGGRQATVELQRVPGIHVDFKVLQLIETVRQGQVKAVILTGTAGDGKTYLAYRIIDAMDGLDREQVLQAQPKGGYDESGFFIDLDLSAGLLTPERVERLHQVLAAPERLTLICANEGKLADLEDRLARKGLVVPPEVLRINLSRRALVSQEAWTRILQGVQAALPGHDAEAPAESVLAQNQAWLRMPDVAERLRRYLLVPYLLGEPITIREVLSFLAYALGGGLRSTEAAGLAPGERIRYLLFNTVFSDPDGFMHGGRATPYEKLLLWLFRLDPAIQASPEIDLELLVNLDKLDVVPPAELAAMWRHDLVVFDSETSDVEYRRRLERFMRYARRWYALASETGFQAYFPFRHFTDYLAALAAPSRLQQEQIPILIRGLNLLLSGGQVGEDDRLQVYYLAANGAQQNATIYGDAAVDEDEFTLESDLAAGIGGEQSGDIYLERLPRRLYLQYSPEVRLPVSLLLYEVLRSAASDSGGFPATLWAKERDTVVRFMSKLNREVRPVGNKPTFTIVLDGKRKLKLEHRPHRQTLKAERG